MVVPVSSDAADVARDVEMVPSNRIRVIRNGIDLAGSPRPLRTVSGWRAVHVARLNVVKDQTTLLRAARMVLDREPRFELDIVGDGEMRPALERLAAELQLGSAVRFHGYRDDVRPFLAAADAFVLSSVSEGIAISLLEAMAAALPVVATRVGGTPEVVVDSGTGYLVPARDPAAMAEALITLLSQPEHARSLGDAGRARVEECFTLGATVQAYESLYLEMLNRRLGPKGPT
jgi:glycosyltransferase involved in cell wall biosynthesis